MPMEIIFYKATCHLGSAGRELLFALTYVLYVINNCWKEGENGREKENSLMQMRELWTKEQVMR